MNLVGYSCKHFLYGNHCSEDVFVWLRKALRTFFHLLVPFPKPCNSQDWPLAKPAAWNSLQISHIDDKYPVTRAIATALQGLHWQEAGVLSQRKESNSSIPIYGTEILIPVLNTRPNICPARVVLINLDLVMSIFHFNNLTWNPPVLDSCLAVKLTLIPLWPYSADTSLQFSGIQLTLPALPTLQGTLQHQLVFLTSFLLFSLQYGVKIFCILLLSKTFSFALFSFSLPWQKELLRVPDT